MKEETIVRQNLMDKLGYTPFCGSPTCNLHSPRTTWDMGKKQFTCGCGWVSEFPDEFIERYLQRWYPGLQTAMQNRCLHCGKEQYAPAVYAISTHGEPCVHCGQKTEVMTVTQYVIKLRTLKKNEKH